MPMTDISRRAAVAVAALLVVLPVIHRGGWLMGALVAALAMLGTREFCLLARRMDIRPFTRTAMAIAAALVVAATAEPFFTGFAPLALTILMGATIVLPVAAVRARGVAEKPLASVCSTLTAALCVGGGLCFAVLLRHLPDAGVAVRAPGPLEGPLLLLFPLAVTWVGDIAAYFAGGLWGHRRLFPVVSPGKTLEGTRVRMPRLDLAASRWLAESDSGVQPPDDIRRARISARRISMTPRPGSAASSSSNRSPNRASAST